jgi:excisionase family DNA binding protein
MNTIATHEYVTAAEAARILGVSRQRVVTMVRDGDLPCIRPWPRQVLIHRDALSAWQAGERREPVTMMAARRFVLDCTEADTVGEVSPSLMADCLIRFIAERRPEWDGPARSDWMTDMAARLHRRS